MVVMPVTAVVVGGKKMFVMMDLATFREVVLARKALASACAVVLERPRVNSTYKDNLGRCELLVWQDGRLQFELNGLGTSDNTRKMLEDCSAAIKEFGDSVQCTALIDMRRGIGCSPLAVPSIVNFLQKDGGRILHTAVLGPRPLMALAQMISRLAKQSGVAFFFDRQEAERWPENLKRLQGEWHSAEGSCVGQIQGGCLVWHRSFGAHPTNLFMEDGRVLMEEESTTHSAIIDWGPPARMKWEDGEEWIRVGGSPEEGLSNSRHAEPSGG
eukprot:s986_g14.t1